MLGQRLTLITGVERDLEPVVAVFAQAHFQSNDLELIRYPGAEAALARATSLRLAPVEMQFVIRDILQSKAFDSWRRGSRDCMIIGRVACNYGENGYDECENLVRREREEVSKWRFFDAISIACCTPSLKIQTVH